VRRREVRCPRLRQRRAEERERVDRSEQDYVGSERPNGLVEASPNLGERPEEAFGLAVYGVRRGPIEHVAALGVRTQDRDAVRREAPDERLQRALDPSHRGG
jgi:hypothetical protein